MTDDYYGVLGVPKDATQDQIKKAYRELALKLHPDRNKSKDAEEQFKKVNEAYAVLGDPEKRKQYDTYGPAGFGQRYSEEDIFRGYNFEDIFRDLGLNINFGSDFSSSGDIFSSMFGGARAQNRGRDILHNLTITLEEVAEGTKKEMYIKHIKRCPKCNGAGNEPGSRIIKCPKCNGSGRINKVANTFFGRMQVVTTCDMCAGSGKTYERKCSACGGRGGVVDTEKVEVQIPPGVSDGMRLRLEGMGDFSQYGSGDLYIEISTKEHRIFRRDGDDIYTNVRVPFHTAILGGNIIIPTLKGTKEITIDEGTQQGKKIVLKGEGIKRFRSNSRGDEIVSIEIDIPTHLSKEEKDIISRFRELDENTKGGGKKFRFF